MVDAAVVVPSGGPVTRVRVRVRVRVAAASTDGAEHGKSDFGVLGIDKVVVADLLDVAWWMRQQRCVYMDYRVGIYQRSTIIGLVD